MTRFLSTAVALALLAAVPAGTVAAAPAPADPALAATGGDPYQAVITRAVKKVEWQRAATKSWQRAFVESMLLVGDGLRTGSDSRAELLYGDGSVTRVGSMTTLTLTGDKRREVHLDAGKLWLHIRKGSAGMKIITPGAVAAVTGTELMVEVDPVAQTTDVTVFEGAVNVTGDVGNLVKVLGGTTTRVPVRAPAVIPFPIDQRKMQERDNMFRVLSTPEATTEPGTQPVGKGPDGKGPDGRGPDGKGPEGKGPDGRGPDARNPNGRGPDGKGPDGKGPDGRGPDGRGPDGRGPDGRGPDGRGPDGPTPKGPDGPDASTPVQPDLKGQTDKLLDPRVINGSPTTGRVKVVIE